MSEIDDFLVRAKTLIDMSLTDLRQSPEKAEIIDLLDQIQKLDNHYKQWCDSYDEEMGEEIGSTYKNGISIEYQIEALWWHDISLAVRKFRRD